MEIRLNYLLLKVFENFFHFTFLRNEKNNLKNIFLYIINENGFKEIHKF